MNRNLLLMLGLMVALGACEPDVEIEGDEAGECDDGVDNNQDGDVDCEDEGCDDATMCADDDDSAGDDDDVTSDDDDATTDDDDSGGDDDDSAGDDDDSAGDDDDSSLAGECLEVSTIKGMDFVHLCAGSFEMGCTAGQQGLCDIAEYPAHQVTLTRDFWIGLTEVTQGQWESLMGNNPSLFPLCGSDCPLEGLLWYEALAFANELSSVEGLAECYTLSGCTSSAGDGMVCDGVAVNSPSASVYDCEGYRLPTEAEWEYAARADADLLYSGSDAIDDVAWYVDNSSATPHPVATKAPNGWGLFDMSGNVNEFAWDYYDYNYYSVAPTTDPEGPTASLPGSEERVMRGGFWQASTTSGMCRVARRNATGMSTTYQGGLRLVRTIP